MIRTIGFATILLCFTVIAFGQKRRADIAGVVNGESISMDSVRNTAAAMATDRRTTVGDGERTRSST